MEIPNDVSAQLDATSPALIEATVLRAIRDAEAANGVLRAMLSNVVPGIDPKMQLRLPPKFTLEFAAAIRLHSWDQLGFKFHRDAGLPDGITAVRSAFRLLTEEGPCDCELTGAVLRLSLNHLSWDAWVDPDVDILIDGEPSDELVDAIAELIWSFRRVNSKHVASEE